MNFSHALIIISVLCVLLLSAGCTQPSGPPVTQSTTVSTPPTTLPTFTPVVTVTTPSLTPGPVDTLPDQYMIAVDVASNGLSINPQITATFQGGKGQNFVSSIQFELIRSDGKVEKQTIYQPLHKGETITLNCTTANTNRAIVMVTVTHNSYIIRDEQVAFRQY